MRHEPVMSREVLEALALRDGDVVGDATIGHGGHASLMLRQIGATGQLIGFDWDVAMLEIARANLENDPRVIYIHADYRALREEMSRLGKRPNAILMDLGLNSGQLEDPSRGISFKYEDAPLDCRMDVSRGEPASAWLNRVTADEIEDVLFKYADERWARRIGRVIVDRRKKAPLRTVADLIAAVLEAIPAGARDKRIHPATRTMQAIRIKVNQELEGLEDAVTEAAESLAPGGRLAILSYHSGEDRAVKVAFRALAATKEFTELTRKPVGPTAAEIAQNPRSRSAKLRVLKRNDLNGSADTDGARKDAKGARMAPKLAHEVSEMVGRGSGLRSSMARICRESSGWFRAEFIGDQGR